MEEEVKSVAAMLRQKAEEKLRSNPLQSGLLLSEVETLRLIHELEVHQIELELQNEELKMAKDQAEIASQKYTELYDFAPSGYFTLCEEGKIKELNFTGAHKLGKERRNLMNCPFDLFVSEETKPIFNLFLQRIFSNRTKEACEVTLSLNDDSSMYVHLSGIVTQKGDQCVVNAVDISERKLAEEALRENEERNHDIILHTSMDGFLMFDNHGFLREVNETYCRMSGYTLQELLSMRVSDLETVDAMEDIDRQIEKAILLGETRFETRQLRKDGSIFYVEISIQYRQVNEGQFVAFIHDITARKQAEAGLSQSEERYRTLFNSMITGFCEIEVYFDENMKAVDYRFLETNAAFEEQTGLINARGKLMRDMIPDQEEHWFKLYGKVALTGELMRFEGEAAGLNRWFDVCAFRMGGPESRRVSVCFSDISERKLAELALQKSEKSLTDIYASMSEGLSINEMAYDAEGKAVDYVLVDANPAFERITGQKLSEVIGKKGSDRYLMEKAPYFDKYAQVVSSGEPTHFETYFAPLNKYLSISAFSPGKGKFVSLYRDITEIKQAEKALFESNEQFQMLFENSPDAILFTKPDGSIFLINPGAERMLGWSKDEISGLGRYDISNVNDPRLIPALEERRKTGSFKGELTFLKKDRTIFPVDFISNLYTDSNGIARASIVARDITERKQAEASLRQSEERYRTLFNSMIEGFSVIEMIFDENQKPVDYRFLETNAVFEEQSGLKDVEGKLIRDMAPDHEQYWFDLYGKIALTGEMMRFENEAQALNRWFEVSAFRMGGEKSLKVVVCFSDITKRKKAEADLQQSEKRHRLLSETMLQGVVHQDSDGRIISMNPAAINILGKTREQFLGSSSVEEEHDSIREDGTLYSGEEHPAMVTLRTGKPVENVVMGVFNPLLNEYRWINIDSVPLFRTGENNPYEVYTIFEDITDRKKAEELLLINNLRLNLAMQAGNMAWWEMDIPTGHVNFEKQKTEMLGYAAEEFTNYRDFMALVHPQDNDRCMNAMRQHYMGLTDRYEADYRILSKSGEYIWCSDIGSITERDANGKPLSITGLAFNINERKRAEEEILTNNARLTLAMKVSNMAWWEMNIVTGAISFEKRKAEMLGYLPGNFKHYNDFMQFVHPEDAERAMEAMRRHLYGTEDKYEVEYRILAKSGEYKWFYDIGSITQRNAKGKAILATGLVTNITERKQAEQIIKESEERRLAILQTAMDGYWLLDIDGRMLEVNETYCQMSGYSKQELLNMHISDLENNETVDDIAARLQDIVEHGESRFETSHRRKDGSIFDIEASVQFQPGEGGQLVVFMHDITERKHSENALRESDERVRFKLQSILSPEGNIANLELNDIIDVPSIQKLMDNFYELVQIPMAIIDVNGKVLVGVGWQDICIKFHRAHSSSCRNCIESDVHLTQGIPDGEFKLYKCKNNMWDMATPLIMGGEHKGNLFLGQFFFESEPVDYQLFREQADQYGFVKREYIEALHKVPRLSNQKLDHAKAFFLNLARSISQLSYSNIKLGRAITQQKIIEDALRESEELLNKAQEIGHFGSWSHDMITSQLTWSDEIYCIFGLQPKELSSTYEGYLEAIHPEDREAVNSAHNNSIVEGKDYYEIEHRIVRKHSGEVRYVWEKGENIRNVSGNVVRTMGMVLDITERKQSEMALIENERLLRESQTIAHIGSYSADLINNSWKVSSEINEIFGIEESHPHTLDALFETIHPDFYGQLVKDLFQVKIEDKNFEHEYKIIRINDGVHRWVQGLGEFEYDSQLNPYRLIGTIQDITDRKVKEEALLKLNKTLATLSKSSQAMAQSVVEAEYLKQVCQIVVDDTDFAMVWIGFAQDDEAKTIRPMASAGFNEDYLQSIKLTWADSDIGRGPTGTAIRTGKMSINNNMLTNPDFQPWREQALKYGYSSIVVFPLKAGDKTFGTITIYSNVPDAFLDDKIQLLSELANDLAHGITTIRLRAAHQLAEEALSKSHNDLEVLVKQRTSELEITNGLLKKEINNVQKKKQSLILAEEKYRTVADHTHGWEFWLDKDDNFVYCSPSCERITGYKAADFIKHPGLLIEIIHPHDKRSFQSHRKTEDLCQVVNHELQYRIIRPDGSIRWIGHECQPIADESGNFMGIRGSNKDITGRKEMEQLLKISSRKYRLLSSNITDGIFTCKNGCLEYVNKSMKRIFGYSHYKMEGLMFSQLALPEYHEELKTIFSINSTVNQLRNIEIECIKKDHSTIHVEIIFNYVAKEKVIYGVVHDITEKKQNQKNIVKAIIQTEEKERANFSKELHDGLGPLLSTIKLYLQCSERPKAPTSREEIIHQAEEIIEEALTTVKEISNRLSPHLLINYGLNSAIKNFISKLEETSDIKIDFITNVSRRLSNEMEAALYRAVIECINNTIKHARATSIDILLDDTGNQLHLEYRDDGIGFDLDETLSKNKGLGLYNLQNRIETIGGKINLVSSPGMGVNYQINVNL